jgi:hypothetical protein
VGEVVGFEREVMTREEAAITEAVQIAKDSSSSRNLAM